MRSVGSKQCRIAARLKHSVLVQRRKISTGISTLGMITIGQPLCGGGFRLKFGSLRPHQ